jgi:protein SCO1
MTWWLLACIGAQEPSWEEAITSWQHPDPLPSLPYVDEAGVSRYTGDLRGDWLLVGFVFTRCGNAEACPLTMHRMVGVQQAVPAETPLEFVVFTIDPAYDTPERLRSYGLAHGADLDRWTLGTGDPVLMREALPSLFNVYALGEGAATQHPVKVVLLDPEQRVRTSWTGAFDSADVLKAMTAP